jgi:hypothetical protein
VSWLIDEDEALKHALEGMTVSDERNPNRPVRVWYGQPDLEVREQAYPYVTIDLVDISEAIERAERGKGVSFDTADLVDSGYQVQGWGPIIQGHMPIPLNLDYQVTSWSRHPRHDRQILQQMLIRLTPFRFGSLVVGNTIRRLDMLGLRKRNVTDENAKRLFANTAMVRVSSEVLASDLAGYFAVETVHVDILEPLMETITVVAPAGTP